MKKICKKQFFEQYLYSAHCVNIYKRCKYILMHSFLFGLFFFFFAFCLEGEISVLFLQKNISVSRLFPVV